jgi:glycerophosphoryl diester phosphodiesterase
MTNHFYSSSNSKIGKLFLNFLFLVIPVLSYGQTMNTSKQLEVQGHRGNRGLRPENCLPSFATAIEAGADALELDLIVSKDGELVIHHDFFVNNELCTYLDGRPLLQPLLIHSLTLAEIKQFDCGRKKNHSFPKQHAIPGTQIPTLNDLFEMIRSSSHPNAKKIRLNLEVKRDPSHPEWTSSPSELARKVLSKVEQNGFTDRVYYSSFDPEVLAAIRSIAPNAQIGFLFDEETIEEAQKIDPQAGKDLQAGAEFFIQLALSLKANILSPHHTFLTDAHFIRRLQQAGFRVVSWTVNEPKRWAELMEMGIDGIISDYPEELIHFLKEKRARQ